MAFNAAIGTLSVKISADTSDVRRGIKDTNKQLSKSDKALQRNKKQWNAWGTTAKVALAGVAILATRSIIKMADSFTSVQNQIRQTTSSTEELTKRTQDLIGVSKRSRIELSTIADIYTQTTLNTEELGLSTEKLLRITETIAKSFAISGKSIAQSSGAIRQLNQAFSRGELRGEEFNSIIEGAPELARAMRRSLKLTQGELIKFAATGGITSKILIKTLTEAADVIDKKMSEPTKTLAQSFQEAETNAIAFFGANQTVKNVSRATGEAMIGLSENLELVADATAIAAAVIGAKLVGALQLSAQKKIESARASTVLAASELRAAKSALRIAKRADRDTLEKLKSIKSVTSAVATEARVNLIALKSSKDKSVQDVISARALDKRTASTVIAAEADVAFAAALPGFASGTERLTAAQLRLAAAKKASELASKSLAVAELNVSAAAGKVTVSKQAASVATTEFTAAKLASDNASKKLALTNALVVSSTKKVAITSLIATKAMSGLKATMAFLGGPVGVAILASIAIASYALSADTAKESSRKLAEKVDDLADSFKKLNEGQIDVKLKNAVVEANRLEQAVLQADLKLKQLEKFGGDKMKAAINAQSSVVRELQEELDEAALKRDALFQAGVDVGRTPEEGTQEDDELKKLADKDELKRQQANDAFARRFQDRQDQFAQEKAQSQAATQEELADFQKQIASKSELEKVLHQEDLARAQETFEELKTSKIDQDAIIEGLERDHKQRLNDIEFTENEMKRQIFERDANTLLNSLATIGKKSLKIQKAISSAQAAVSISTGIARAQELGFPANIVEMARVAAVGVSAIRSIKGASIGSATTPSGNAGGGGAGGGGAQPVQQAPAQQVNRTIDIRFTGQGVMSQEQVRMLIEQINEATGDGAQLNVVGG